MSAKAVAMMTVATVSVVGSASACDLKMEPSRIFETSCEVLVGYYNGQRVGPFHISLPDGSFVTAGTCPGFIGVTKVEGNTVSLEAFHTVPAREYTLAYDCRSSVRTH